MRLSWAVLATAMALASRAVAQESDEPIDEAPPADETAPEVEGEVPPGVPPPETVPPPVAALPPEADATFGSFGQVTISSDLEAIAKRISTDGQSGHHNTIQIRPALDIFPVANLSIGGQLIIGYDAIDVGEYDSAVELGLLVRAGYNVVFSPKVSFWPRVAIGYRHVSGALSPGRSMSEVSAVPFELYLPVVVQLASHFFVGGGPLLATSLYYERQGVLQNPKTSEIGLQSTVGGYFKGF